ncbi:MULTISPECIES: type II secretion system F family protein [unclassified Schlesneria]|uniref:type II secretion system F family protein n=1 Tax=Schlesneria TaxID=656899 RepID=UPI002EE25797
MDGTQIGLISGPFALLFASIVVRVISAVQPEGRASAARRSMLNQLSYVLMAIAIGGLVFLTFAGYAIGFFGLLIGLVVCVSLITTDLRVASARARANQVEFLWLLALAVRSGRPLADEIEAYAKGTDGRRHRILMDLTNRLREGIPLTELAVPQGLLPRSAALQIHCGVTSATLHDTLRATAVRVTKELTDDEDEAGNIASAMIYPSLIVPITCLIVAFLMYQVIPKFGRIFADFGTELPTPTVLLIQISRTVSDYWYLYLAPLFYVPLGILILSCVGQYYGWRVVLQSLLGHWFIRWHSPDVLRAAALCVNQGTPLDKALHSIAKHPGPLRLRQRLAWAIDTLQEGAPQWQTLQRAGIVTYSEAVVLETAENSGNLSWAMDMVASQMEQRTAFRLAALTEILRPIVLLAVALSVAMVVICIFLPLIKLLNDLS